MRSRLSLAVLILVALLAAPTATATAAPPANDAFAAPVTLTSGAPALLADNLGATSEPTETSPFSYWDDCSLAFDERPDCGNSVWYAFTAPATDSYTIDTCDKGTELDTTVVAYEGTTLAGLTNRADDDDSCDGGFGGNGSTVTIAATEGTTYRIQVTGYGGQEGTFYIRAYPSASPPPAPAIDTRITRYQSVISDPPRNSERGTHSGGRRTASFAFVSTSATASYECALDTAAYAPCSSPVGYDGVAADGTQHTFRVRAVEGSADATPAVQKFTIDRTAPDTSLTTGPAEGATVTGGESLGHASTERNPPFGARCAVDGGDLFECNGLSVQLDPYCDGSHTIGVRALDEAGNLDPTPAVRTVTAAGNGPCATPEISANPASPGATRADLEFPATIGGAPATLIVRYGTSAAYGEQQSQHLRADGATIAATIDGLLPETLYHYEATLRTPGGATATTGDQTFTTTPSGADTPPTATLGTPIVTGPHTARLPITLTGGANATYVATSVRIDTGPVTRDSQRLRVDNDVLTPSGFPVQTAVDAVDLEPGTTYRYRVFLESSTNLTTFDSVERTFTTPALPVPPVVTPAGGPAPPPAPAARSFRLTAGNLSVGAFKRSAKKLKVTVKGVPSGTKLALTVKGSKKLATAKATASKAGTATFTVKLSTKARKALKAKRLKRLSFTVTATPPSGKASSVTVTKRLK